MESSILKPFDSLKSANLIEMLFFAFNLLLITLSSTANAARTMFNASWRKFPSVFSMYGFFKI